MIEAIGCEDVMTTWEEAIAEDKSGIRISTADSTAKAICQLIERAQVRTHATIVNTWNIVRLAACQILAFGAQDGLLP